MNDHHLKPFKVNFYDDDDNVYEDNNDFGLNDDLIRGDGGDRHNDDYDID